MFNGKLVRTALITTAVCAILAPNLATAETTTAEARVKWTAKATKKSEISLSVFTDGNSSLEFAWDPSNQRFSSQNSSLTIQAAGIEGASGYGIQAQLIQNKLLSAAPGSQSSLALSMDLGGIKIGDTPVDILRGTGNGTPTIAAQGMQHMILGMAGTRTAGKGTYHEATGVGARFDVVGGTDDTGKQIAVDALDSLADGQYAGDVELRLTASWDNVTSQQL